MKSKAMAFFFGPGIERAFSLLGSVCHRGPFVMDGRERGRLEMRRGLGNRARVVAMGCLLAAMASANVLAQEGSVEEGKRKVRSKIAAVYPDLAKRMYVSGKVKLEVVVSAEGKVRLSRILGGHPLLAKSAQEAVKEWKFEPAGAESTVLVEFTFRLTEG